jgi:hypothetical protein
MRFLNTWVMACCSLWALGCGTLSFETTVKGGAEIPGNNSLLPVLLDTFPGLGGFTTIDFDQNQEFQNQGATKENVDSVKAVSYQLQIQGPASQDFAFLDSLEFYAQADGLPEVLLAKKTGIASLQLPTPNPTLELDLQDVELKPYVTKPSMGIAVRGTGRQPKNTTQLEARVKLKVFFRLIK